GEKGGPPRAAAGEHGREGGPRLRRGEKTEAVRGMRHGRGCQVIERSPAAPRREAPRAACAVPPGCREFAHCGGSHGGSLRHVYDLHPQHPPPGTARDVYPLRAHHGMLRECHPRQDGRRRRGHPTPRLSLEKGAECMIETLPRLLVLQACDQRIQQATHTLNTLQQSLAAVKEEERVKRQAVCAWQEKITEREKACDHLTRQIEHVKEQVRGKRYALHRCGAGQREETVQEEIALLGASKAALEEELSVVTA